MSTAILLAALCMIPVDGVIIDRVDLIEVNHMYDGNGRLVFDQVIFYDWDRASQRHQVVAWRLLKHPTQYPTKNPATGDYSATWNDGETIRQVNSRSFDESWTQHDPEIQEREFLPQAQRRELTRPYYHQAPTPPELP